MKKLLTACMTSALIMSSSMVKAEDEFEIAANVAFATDYLFYGATQSNGGPAVSGGFDLALPFGFGGGEFYVGTWASSVEQGGTADQASLELDFYGGIAGDSIGGTGISWDIGGWFYTYPDQDSDAGGNDFDYVEAYANFGYAFDTSLSPNLSVGVYYSPDYFGGTNRSIYIPVGLDISLPNDFGLYFSYGYFDLDVAGTDSYSHYGFGITKALFGVDLDLSWTGNDNDCEVVQGVNCGGVVFAASKSF